MQDHNTRTTGRRGAGVVIQNGGTHTSFSSRDPRKVVPLQGHALLFCEVVAREQRLDVRERRLFAVVVSLLAARRRDAMRSRADCGTVGFAV